PPVLETIVAEVYGPEQKGQIEIARQIRTIFEKTPGVVDVDWYVEDDSPKYLIRLDREKAALNGISTQDAARVVSMVGEGASTGLLHASDEKEDVPILVRLARPARSDLERLKNLKVRSGGGGLVA